eukprot:197366-Alexandrium_andersonii.AAC.1
MGSSPPRGTPARPGRRRGGPAGEGGAVGAELAGQPDLRDERGTNEALGVRIRSPKYNSEVLRWRALRAKEQKAGPEVRMDLLPKL